METVFGLLFGALLMPIDWSNKPLRRIWTWSIVVGWVAMLGSMAWVYYDSVKFRGYVLWTWSSTEETAAALVIAAVAVTAASVYYRMKGNSNG